MANEKDGMYVRLGNIMLQEVGKEACLDGYQTADPYFVGVLALRYQDINPDGTLN